MTRTAPRALSLQKKVLRKSPYEGRTWWRKHVRKKPYGPARIAYGPHTGILSIARARCELKQLCYFSVKKSDVSEHYEFDYPKIEKKKTRKKKEKRGGHIIKCLLTELGRAGRENIWPSFMAHGPRCARSVRNDLGPNIFPSSPPTQSISTYHWTVDVFSFTFIPWRCVLYSICLWHVRWPVCSVHIRPAWAESGKAWKLSKKICFSTKVAAADFNVLYRGCWFDLPQNTGQPWFSVFKSSRLTSMECNLRVISERGRPVKSRTDRWNDGPSDHFTSISHKVTSNK